ncbi:hypothetical protein G9A89_015861 [Geosiphon pyriformis]|nr:hypothetical protein G9A89_015861 [Geosiphon pyriformis]
MPSPDSTSFSLTKWAKQKFSKRKSAVNVLPKEQVVVVVDPEKKSQEPHKTKSDGKKVKSRNFPWQRSKSRRCKDKESRRGLKNTDDLVSYEDYDKIYDLSKACVMPDLRGKGSFYSEVSSTLHSLTGKNLPPYSPKKSQHLPPPYNSLTSDEDDDDTEKDFEFAGPTIIYGSVQHFAYLRTMRKLRTNESRPMTQKVTMNTLLDKLHEGAPLTEEQEQELRNYKSRVLFLEAKAKEEFEQQRRLDRALRKAKHLSRSSTATFAIDASMMPRRYSNSRSGNKRFSGHLARIRPGLSPVMSQHRPSYASRAVVTTIDEDNEIVVRDLPIVRRHRRQSGQSTLSNTSSTIYSSMNNFEMNRRQIRRRLSSGVLATQLVTVTASSLSQSLLRQRTISQVKKQTESTLEDGTKEEDLCEKIEATSQDETSCRDEDDVSLYALKEQFRYSGMYSSVAAANSLNTYRLSV